MDTQSVAVTVSASRLEALRRIATTRGVSLDELLGHYIERGLIRDAALTDPAALRDVEREARREARVTLVRILRILPGAIWKRLTGRLTSP